MTKLLATEFALKGVDVHVNAIAPGVYESELTYDNIGPDLVDKIGKGIAPVPAKRAGRRVFFATGSYPCVDKTPRPSVEKRWRVQ